MGYDEGLAHRVRQLFEREGHFVERKMFGGVAFMINGNMACGITGEDLMVRVGKESYEDALAKPHVKPFDMTGRPMKGWVSVGAEAIAEETQLNQWVQRGMHTARSLPPK